MTNNKLKIIAVISMIIDHFGYYFNYLLSDEIYLICRIIGRLAMPIFTYLIVEGYFHTKDFGKYIKRLGILAIVTQIAVVVLDIIAKDKTYKIGYTANILFTFVILLLLIKIFEKAIKISGLKFKLFFSIYTVIIYCIYNFINFDYGIYLLVLGFGMYIIKRYINNIYLYKIMISILIFVISFMMGGFNQFAVLSCIFIVMYNGKLGKKSNTLRNIFYIIFPIQHILLYGTYILINHIY